MAFLSIPSLPSRRPQQAKGMALAKQLRKYGIQFIQCPMSMWNICEITMNHIYPWCDDHYFWNWHELTIHKWSEIDIYEVGLKWTSHIAPTNGIQPSIKNHGKNCWILRFSLGKRGDIGDIRPEGPGCPHVDQLQHGQPQCQFFPIFWSLCFWGTMRHPSHPRSMVLP